MHECAYVANNTWIRLAKFKVVQFSVGAGNVAIIMWVRKSIILELCLLFY